MSLQPGAVISIVRADYLGGHQLRLTFSDDHHVMIDFGPFLRSALNPQTSRFLDEECFQAFAIVHGNLVWGDYEMCFPIEHLYVGNIDGRESYARGMAVAEPRAEYNVKSPKVRKTVGH